MSGFEVLGRFHRNAVGIYLTCLGIDTQAASVAPVREGAWVYECADYAEAVELRSLLVGFGLAVPAFEGARKFPGVFHHGDDSFVFFAPVPDHACNFGDVAHG